MSEQELPQKIDAPKPWVFRVIVLGVFASWLGAPYLVKFFFGTDVNNVENVYAPINTLFSGLAFACIVFTMFMQRVDLALTREELRLQRIEFEKTREEIKGQKEQAELQNAMLSKQGFEGTFFQLLRLHNDIVNAIDIDRGNGKIMHGRDCFVYFAKRFGELSTKAMLGMPANTGDELVKRITRAYSTFFKTYERDLGHYFRSIYNLVKIVDQSSISDADKRIYTNLVRAQLSKYELVLLFYNCLSSQGSAKFKPLVEKYSLLKHFDFKHAIHGAEDRALYQPSAFGA